MSSYQLHTPLSQVKGIGSKLFEELQKHRFSTIKDVILSTPLRYEDRSQFFTIAQAPQNQLVTIEAEVLTASRGPQRGRRSLQTATISDHTGKLKVLWFNNSYILHVVKPGKKLLFSGKISDKKTLIQPKVEQASGDTIHTGRIVPVYSSTLPLKMGTWRRVLKEITDHLQLPPDTIADQVPQLLTLQASLQQLHFPQELTQVLEARRRLAIEELIQLIKHSAQLKKKWQAQPAPPPLNSRGVSIPLTIPFELTADQLQSIDEVITDLSQPKPMNRLLVGDVGSGKTIVAGVAAHQILQAGGSIGLVAPTQILAEQHLQTLSKFLPDCNWQLITSQTKPSQIESSTGYIGTHAVLNYVAVIKPRLLIFDEQHRFGVNHRSIELKEWQPHILTMSATPIPRSMMLSIFSHLDISRITQPPPGKKPATTWLTPPTKRTAGYTWMMEQLDGARRSGEPQIALVVCPFINKSESDQFAHVKSIEELEPEILDYLKSFPNLSAAILHGQQPKKLQSEIISNVSNNQIDILITTPVVEVGVDLPAASYICIESAERFGLASLHQLRGRVGRAGQESYCLVLPSTTTANPRLKVFAQENNGFKLAEYDLAQRGAGDIFGTQQTGFEQLRFASWGNLDTLEQAQKLAQALPSTWQSSILPPLAQTNQIAAN